MPIHIKLIYQTPQGAKTEFYSDPMDMKDAIQIAEDLEKTGRKLAFTFLDDYDHSWTLKELKKYTEEIQSEPHNIIVYFDGGFHKEKKAAGLGCVIYFDKSGKSYRLRKNIFAEGLESNNEAEYAALDLGLKELENLEVHHLPVTFIGDAMVVINQMNDEWPCYDDDLEKWIDRIENRIGKMGLTASYKLVSRKDNQEADKLATQALNKVEIEATSEVAETDR
ncbi:reverse transcriptase-like protein [Virgibacillus halophilus]|uniref:Reverse transcriptase-like protein n=1 Tax=Tigheibacillus halophilus TaxID=361280 RepID=A0ABU5CA47_9BACI|nr:reverse transcriptase-like protein [Virgibacillus halophilus]